MDATPGCFGAASSDAALRDAVELLRRVLREVPRAALPRDTHARINALVSAVTGAPAVDPSEAPTVAERPRLRAVTLTLRQYIVLERALRSPRLQSTFADVHHFLLTAGRGYEYAPAPPCLHVEVPRNTHGERTVAFKRRQLDELQARAVDAGATSVEAYVVGCAFALLHVLQRRWPDDADLNAHRPPTPIPVIHFPSK